MLYVGQIIYNCRLYVRPSFDDLVKSDYYKSITPPPKYIKLPKSPILKKSQVSIAPRVIAHFSGVKMAKKEILQEYYNSFKVL